MHECSEREASRSTCEAGCEGQAREAIVSTIAGIVRDRVAAGNAGVERGLGQKAGREGQRREGIVSTIAGIVRDRVAAGNAGVERGLGQKAGREGQRQMTAIATSE